MNDVFYNRIIDKLSFNQWLNIEYGMVKREFKESSDNTKIRLKKEYKDYLSLQRS